MRGALLFFFQCIFLDRAYVGNQCQKNIIAESVLCTFTIERPDLIATTPAFRFGGKDVPSYFPLHRVSGAVLQPK